MLIAELPVMITHQDSAHYEMIWQTATQAQRGLLIALAADPDAFPYSKDFQLRHGIGPSSSIKASLVSLEKKGIIHRAPDGRYRFMPYWIEDIRTSTL